MSDGPAESSLTRETHRALTDRPPSGDSRARLQANLVSGTDKVARTWAPGLMQLTPAARTVI